MGRLSEPHGTAPRLGTVPSVPPCFPVHGSVRLTGFTLVEVIIGVILFALLVASVMWVFVYGGRSTGRLSSQLSLQQSSRKAIVRFLRELQEGMEVLSPSPGSTLSYALIRDKVSLVRWFYLIPASGTPGVFELRRYVKDPKLSEEKRTEIFLQNVKRLTFTCRSEGALQIHLVMKEDDQEYALLTSVRLRNLASAETLW